MTLHLEIPEELAQRLGPEPQRLSREAIGLEALRQGLWSEPELARFLGLSRFALDAFLKSHSIDIEVSWEDLERERAIHESLASRHKPS